MFLRKKTKLGGELKTPLSKKKKVWRIIAAVFAVLLILGLSYLGYIYASGKKIFDPNNSTIAPFFKSLSGQSYTLRGEGDGRINILLLGQGGSGHPGGNLTDSIMVLSINPDDKTYAMLSIPRDLYVPIAGAKTSVKINEVYSYGENKQKGSGAALVKQTVDNILDLPIHYYVLVDFTAFKTIVDQIGGIDVYVEKAIYDPYYPDAAMKGYEPFKLKAGQQHLDGGLALKYARSRETSSDFDRAARQQKVIGAIRDKVLTAGFLANPKKVVDLVNTVSNHVKTDLTADDIYALSKLASQLDSSKTVSKVLTDGSGGELYSDSSTGTYLLYPKDKTWESIQRIAHEIFTDPSLKKESANIEVLNASKTAGLALKLSDTLTSYNYKVVNVTNSPTHSATTIIYDYSGGSKSTTLQFLKSRLNCQVVTKARPTGSSVDISIVIGDDYKGFSKTPS